MRRLANLSPHFTHTILKKSFQFPRSALTGCLFVAGLLLSPPNTTEELQQQIQQRKQLYEQQISAHEGRIASLEQANRAAAHAAQENTVSLTNLEAGWRRKSLRRKNRNSAR